MSDAKCLLVLTHINTPLYARPFEAPFLSQYGGGSQFCLLHLPLLFGHLKLLFITLPFVQVMFAVAPEFCSGFLDSSFLLLRDHSCRDVMPSINLSALFMLRI
jgi:hypothetical protein